MKSSKCIMLLLTVMLAVEVLYSSCKTPSGTLQGTVQLGAGDCMPMIDYSARKYEPFTGKVYAFRKSWLDSMNTQTMDILRKGNKPIPVKKGKLNTDLTEGTYVIMPADMYFYQVDNTVTVPAKGGVTRDLRFFKCLTF